MAYAKSAWNVTKVLDLFIPRVRTRTFHGVLQSDFFVDFTIIIICSEPSPHMREAMFQIRVRILVDLSNSSMVLACT